MKTLGLASWAPSVGFAAVQLDVFLIICEEILAKLL